MRKLSIVFISLLLLGVTGCRQGGEQMGEAADTVAAEQPVVGEKSNCQGKTVADTPSANAKMIVHSIPVHIVPGRLRSIFNDTNGMHLSAAESIGIKPIKNLRDAYNLQRPIVRIATNEHYTVDSLTHSMPFLVPKQRNCLRTLAGVLPTPYVAEVDMNIASK